MLGTSGATRAVATVLARERRCASNVLKGEGSLTTMLDLGTHGPEDPNALLFRSAASFGNPKAADHRVVAF